MFSFGPPDDVSRRGKTITGPKVKCVADNTLEGRDKTDLKDEEVDNTAGRGAGPCD